MCWVVLLQVEDETQVSRATQAEQDHYEMHVRAANIVSTFIILYIHTTQTPLKLNKLVFKPQSVYS